MANNLETFGQLLDETAILMKEVVTTFEKDPIKAFDIIGKLRDNFEKIGEVNANEELFDEDEDNSEFLEHLSNFNEITEEYRSSESSPYSEVLNNDKYLQILVDLDRRYEKLAD